MRKGATGVPPSPRTSAGNNGGEVVLGVWELHKHREVKVELRGDERVLRKGGRELK